VPVVTVMLSGTPWMTFCLADMGALLAAVKREDISLLLGCSEMVGVNSRLLPELIEEREEAAVSGTSCAWTSSPPIQHCTSTTLQMNIFRRIFEERSEKASGRKGFALFCGD
jgi:hypothetical protein